MGSCHLRPPVFFMSSYASLPIIDLTYRLVLEVNRAVGEFPRSQRPGLGRRGEAAAFDLLEALGAALVAGRAASPEPASRGTLQRESDWSGEVRLSRSLTGGERCLLPPSPDRPRGTGFRLSRRARPDGRGPQDRLSRAR